MEYMLWFLAVAVGPLLLAGVMIYALMRRRRLTRAEQLARNEKTAELYGHDRHEGVRPGK